MNFLYDISAVEIGQHFYWNIGEYHVHGQVLLNTWLVLTIILVTAIVTTRELKSIPDGGQNFIEFFLEFIRDIAKTLNH